MMDGVNSTANLSARERAYVEHAKRAQESGESLSEYCRKAGLNVKEWYGVKRTLVKRGVLAGRRSQGGTTGQVSPDRSRKSLGFIPVRVTAPMVEVTCRIRHPHGWVLECMRMPEARWVAALMAEASDASPAR